MWPDGFAEYLASYEVRLHRRTNTFGGKTWPDSTPGLIGPQAQLQIAMAVIERKSA